jgi:DNA (cytosine-5)-methyltransferase 1
MRSGDIDKAPIWDDVRTLRKELLPKQIDIVYGGFPCQDISVAGTRKGLEGKRSGLFFEIVRLTKEVRPSFVFLENVPAIRTRGLGQVIKKFTEMGYDCRWTCISARDVGACHKRERWFFLAHSNSTELWNQQGRGSREDGERETEPSNNGQEKYNSHPTSQGLSGENGEESPIKTEIPKPAGYHEWKSEPTICGRDHGISNRVDRIRSLGNSVVPVQAKAAFKRLMGFPEIYL